MPGRDAEFTAWAQAETPGLLRRAYLLTADWQQAEDLVQETLVRLYVGWSRVDRDDNPVGYAHTTLFHVFVSGDHLLDGRPDRRSRCRARWRPTIRATSTTPDGRAARTAGRRRKSAGERLHAADRVEVEHVDALIAGSPGRRVPRTIPPAKPGVTSAQVLDLVTGYLPEGMSVETRAASPWVTRGGVALTLEDADGPAQAEAGILRPSYEPGSGCTRQGHCRRVRAGGKTFYEYTDWKTRKGFRHYDVATYYHRPDGLVTRVMQHNFVDDGGPVTRPTPRGLDPDEGWPVTGATLPLTEAEVLALLTAPEWEALAARCQPDPTIGGC